MFEQRLHGVPFHAINMSQTGSLRESALTSYHVIRSQRKLSLTPEIMRVFKTWFLSILNCFLILAITALNAIISCTYSIGFESSLSNQSDNMHLLL